jgi:hypothetical protein
MRDEKMELQKEFSSKQEELEVKGHEIKKIQSKFGQVKGELDDM